jgi:hypothetical protein
MESKKQNEYVCDVCGESMENDCSGSHDFCEICCEQADEQIKECPEMDWVALMNGPFQASYQLFSKGMDWAEAKQEQGWSYDSIREVLHICCTKETALLSVHRKRLMNW